MRSMKSISIQKWELRPYHLQVLQRNDSLINSKCYGSAHDKYYDENDIALRLTAAAVSEHQRAAENGESSACRTWLY